MSLRKGCVAVCRTTFQNSSLLLPKSVSRPYKNHMRRVSQNDLGTPVPSTPDCVRGGCPPSDSDTVAPGLPGWDTPRTFHRFDRRGVGTETRTGTTPPLSRRNPGTHTGPVEKTGLVRDPRKNPTSHRRRWKVHKSTRVSTRPGRSLSETPTPLRDGGPRVQSFWKTGPLSTTPGTSDLLLSRCLLSTIWTGHRGGYSFPLVYDKEYRWKPLPETREMYETLDTRKNN